MNGRRTLIIAVAVVLGALAAVGVVRYLATVDQRAFDNAELVRVFVVKRDIPRDFDADRAIREGLIGTGSIPRRFRPATALTQLEEIRGMVAITALPANQVLIKGLFVDPRTNQRTFSSRIPAGQVALTVSVDQVRGVAGLLVPGDRVNILVGDAGSQRVLYQNVLVLAIGNRAAPQAGEQPAEQPEGGAEATTTPSSNLVTFAVPPLAAERIAFAAQQGGGVYLTLVPPDNKPTPIPPVTPGNLFTGGLTPEQG